VTRYFVVEPEVAGGWGDNTIADTDVHPPVVIHLHYEFEGWLGDELLESFPCFVVTRKLAAAIEEAGLNGASFESVEISVSENFKEAHPRVALPSFVRFVPTGKAGVGDFGISDGRLVVSERALRILKKARLRHADVTPFDLPNAGS
jgi:hypothetical protein